MIEVIGRWDKEGGIRGDVEIGDFHRFSGDIMNCEIYHWWRNEGIFF